MYFLKLTGIFAVFLILGGSINNSFARNPERKYTNEFIPVGTFELPEGPVNFIEDNKGNLIITVKGENGFIGSIKGTIIETLVKGFISDAALGPDGNIWYLGKNSIKSVSSSKTTSDKDFLPLFFKDKKPDILTESGEPHLYRDRAGSIWLLNAPSRIGADMQGISNPNSGLNTTKHPLPQATDPFGNMWGLITTDDMGKKAIAVLPSRESEKWTVYDEKDGFPAGQWNSVIADIEGIIWVSGNSGLCSFNPRNPKRGWLTYPSDSEYPGGAVSFMTLSPTGHALTALQTGEIYELNTDSKEAPVINRININGIPKYPLSGLYTDKAGRIMVVVKNKLYRQDKEEAAWQPLTPMPYGNHDLFGVELNGKIYTAGGGAYHGFPVKSENFDCLLIYDIQNDRWDMSPPMSTNHRYCSVGLLEGKIWVIGGFNKSDKTPEKKVKMWDDSPMSTVEIYDPVNRTWTTGPSLDVPRAETVACTMVGRLYVFGSTGNDIFNTLSIAPGETQWRIEPAAPYPVFQTTGSSLYNRAFIMAGGNGLIMYDPLTQSWQNDLPMIPGLEPPLSSIVVTYNNEIWVISGRGNDDGTKVWIYSPQDKKWRAGPSFPYPTMWANGIEVNGSLYIYGGATQSKIRNSYVYWDAIRILK